jgi:lysophospholipase L1-like esterase
MTGHQRAQRFSRRPRLVALSLLAISLLGASWPREAPDTSGIAAAIAAHGRGPTRPVEVERSTPSPVASNATDPAATIAPAHTAAALMLDTAGGPAPTRPVVDVPPAEPRIVLGPGTGSTAVFLGDSFTSGWDGAGLGAAGWPRLVGAARGWRTVNLAVAGTGFRNPGWTNQPIAARVSTAVQSDADVIVVAGGHNDSRWSAAATARAADDVIDRLRTAAPDALLVIVAPIWQNGSPPSRALALRDHLRQKSDAIGAVFVDPLAEGWFSGPSHRFVGPDGLHPTDAGHRFIAEHILAALEQG